MMCYVIIRTDPISNVGERVLGVYKNFEQVKEKFNSIYSYSVIDELLADPNVINGTAENVTIKRDMNNITYFYYFTGFYEYIILPVNKEDIII
jgi:hypothetical protein